jgi:hypothetical protein
MRSVVKRTPFAGPSTLFVGCTQSTMASSSAALVLALFLSLGVGHVLGQPTTLTVAGANSTASPRQFGAPALDIFFEPPVVQVTGDSFD